MPGQRLPRAGPGAETIKSESQVTADALDSDAGLASREKSARTDHIAAASRQQRLRLSRASMNVNNDRLPESQQNQSMNLSHCMSILFQSN